MIALFGGKRSGLYLDPTKELADVYKCLKVLKLLEPRWHIAARLGYGCTFAALDFTFTSATET